MNFNRVYRSLYIGPAPSNCAEVNVFDLVVFAAKEYQPSRALFSCVGVLYAPMTDFGEPMTDEEKQTALDAAHVVAQAVSKGARVLSTCKMGLNRSSLIAGLAVLMLDPRMNAQAVVTLIRQARGRFALSNPYFVEFLQIYSQARVFE